MHYNTKKLAKEIRDMYLVLDKNFSLFQSIDIMDQEEVVLEELFDDSNLEEFKKQLEEFMRKDSGQQNLMFSDDFDFVKNNQENKQIHFGQDLLINRIIHGLKKNQGLEMASIGIGEGTVTAKYAKNLNIKNITGIDLHENYMDIASQKIPGLKKIQFDLNSREPLPLEDDAFDGVECSMVLHHVQDFEKRIQEISMKLRKGGRFFYLDVCDKTHPEKEMEFSQVHKHPPYHGIEFFRDHESIKKIINKHLNIIFYKRIGPGLIYVEAEK